MYVCTLITANYFTHILQIPLLFIGDVVDEASRNHRDNEHGHSPADSVSVRWVDVAVHFVGLVVDPAEEQNHLGGDRETISSRAAGGSVPDVHVRHQHTSQGRHLVMYIYICCFFQLWHCLWYNEEHLQSCTFLNDRNFCPCLQVQSCAL